MKLSPGIFILIGFCLLVCGFSYGWINWAPNMNEANARDQNKEAADTQAAKMNAANKRVKDAQALVIKTRDRWRAIAATKTPAPNLGSGGIDISRNGAQLIVDSLQFRNSIQAAVNRQLLSGGVKLVSGQGPRIPEPSESPSTILAEFYNYPAIPFPVVIFDLGTVTVAGTYQQITANMRSWANMPNYLAVADGLSIQGTSPHLQGTYAVSMVGYIRGSKVFMTLPEIPGSSSNGQGGGSPFGGGGPASPTATATGGGGPGSPVASKPAGGGGKRMAAPGGG